MEIEEMATKIFHEFGLEFKTAVRAGGWTNAVWINNNMVLRISLTENSNKIRREVQLSKYLSHKVGYPKNIENGIIDGFEWSVSEKVNGVNLSEIWPKLKWSERTLVAKQLWSVMMEVHSVSTDDVKNLSSLNPWYSSLLKEETMSRFKYYIDNGIFTSKEASALINILTEFWNEYKSSQWVLNHGDITNDNLLWKDGKIVSLLDFEYSVIAPDAIDLNSYINLVLFDEDIIKEDILIEDILKEDILKEDILKESILVVENDLEYQNYKSEILKLIRNHVNSDNSKYLLMGFAILYHLRFLEFWINEPDQSLTELNAYKKLSSFAKYQAGYLSDIINI